MRNPLLRLFALFVFVACNQVNVEDIPSVSDSVEEMIDHQFSVSSSDVFQYLTMHNREIVSTRGTETDPTIDPIIDIYGDTIFFVINYHPGWELISSDRRTPIVLAESSEGDFCIQTVQDAVAEWLEMTAEDLRSVNNVSPATISNSNELGELSFHEVWASICEPDSFLRGRNPSTRSGEGEYWLYNSVSETEIVEEIPHLTQTRWHQGWPYNIYCPERTDSIGVRVPAGCVPVAGAQMLYYLHSKLGRPATTPSQGYCYGQVGNFSQGFSNFSATPFSNMTSSYAALLIGFVGQSVGVNYGNTSSGAKTEDLVDVFDGFGITCDFGNYNEATISSHLLNEMPVIVRADGTKKTILGIHYYRNGHAFIIDGFRKKRQKVTNTYAWSWISEDPDSLGVRCFDLGDMYTEITYTTPYISQIKINWGFRPIITNDPYNEWYTLTGNWHVSDDEDEYDFDYRRKMIYNFALKNE